MTESNQLTQGKYGGRVVKKVQTNGIILTTTHYDAHLHIPVHYHENTILTFVTTGLYQERLGTKTISCTSNSFMFHQSSMEHSNQFANENAGCFNIELIQSWLNKFDISKPAFAFVSVIKEPLINNLVNMLIKEFNTNDPASAIIIEGMTIEIVGRLIRHNNADRYQPVWLKTVRELLHLKSLENLSLEELSAATGISPFHIVREFKKHCGTTIGEYVTKLKISHACTLLQNKEYSLVMVGLECGFSDQSHFGNTFKRVMGLTPLAYRKTAILS